MNDDYENDYEDEDEDEEGYQFDDVDRTVVSITRQLITKVLRSDLLDNAQQEVLQAVARVFAALPETPNLNASFSVIGPTREFGEHKIHHYWTVELEDQQIEVKAGGYFWRPSTGGDSFASFRWIACPGGETECQDFAESLGIVDDAKPFGSEIDELDLNEPGYSISVSLDGEDVGDETDEDWDEEGEDDEEGEEDATGGEAHTTPELTACLWAFMDADTRRIYALGGRAYSLAGSDEAKLQILRGLSRHDYRSITRFKVPERFKIQFGDGSQRSGVASPRTVNDPSAMLFEDVFVEIEKTLPPIPDFANNRPLTQKFANDPLCVRTVVYEDAAGNCRAIVDEHDRAWLERQMASIS